MTFTAAERDQLTALAERLLAQAERVRQAFLPVVVVVADIDDREWGDEETTEAIERPRLHSRG